MPKHCRIPDCGGPVRRDSKTGLCFTHYRAEQLRSVAAATPTVDADREQRRQKADASLLKQKYESALKTIERQESELRSLNILNEGRAIYKITPTRGSSANEGTVVIAASDWHLEEKVGTEVGGLNRYDLDIARQRVERFFQGALSLTNLLGQDIRIDTIVLALLGDFITNDIHDELKELALLPPMQAIVFAQNLITSGIQYILDHSAYKLVIPCHSGNHARTTKTTHFSAENGHSLEWLMYVGLAGYFRHEPRVSFIIPEGYHSYMQIYDWTVRFHHGHAIKYGGGIGGIFIPAFKAISQWSKAQKADLDVFGHFHQMKDGGNFLSNGSLIGYNGFALSIKADFERPKQLLFLIDRKRGRTATWPIFV
jgi:hypothetical protein